MSNDNRTAETIVMETKKPIAGDVVYLSGGEIVRFLARNSDNRFVVEIGRREGEDDEDSEIFFDGVRTVDNVYLKPPVDAVEKRIAELEAKERSIRDAINDLQKTRREESEALNRLKSFYCLKDIDSYLQGKITHYVVWEPSYGNDKPSRFRISTPQSEKCGNDQQSKDLKLLGLYGKQDWNRKGVSPDPMWQLMHYSDGSGGRSECVKPFLSLEEAKEFAAVMVSEALAHFEKSDCNHKWTLQALSESCTKCFYPVPQWLSDRLKKSACTELQAEVERCAKALQAAQAKLAGAA